MILLRHRAELVPVKPLFCDGADVAEIARAQRRHGEELREQRLVRFLHANERVQLDTAAAGTARTARATPSAGSALPIGAATTLTAAWAALVWPRKGRVQPVAQILFTQQAALGGVPGGEPPREGGMEFGAGQRAVLARVGGGEDGRSHEPRGREVAPSASALLAAIGLL